MRDLVPFISNRHSLSRSVFDEMDKLFNQAFGKDFFPQAVTRSSYPKMNIYDEDNKLHFDVYVPEVDKDNISIEINEDNILTISGKASKSTELEKTNYYVKEVSERAFSRSVLLPDTLDTDKIDSSHLNGMLKIIIPYKEVTVVKDKVRKINIK